MINKPVIHPQEAKLLQGLLSGMSKVDAVRAAGYELTNPKSCANLADFIWKKHGSSNTSIVAALENVGVTPERVAAKLADKLDATQTIKVGSGKNAQMVEVEDNSTQMKALDMVMKTVGGYAPTKTEHVEMKFEHILMQIEGDDD